MYFLSIGQFVRKVFTNILCPPLCQYVIILSCQLCRPIQLRGNVIYKTSLNPLNGIASLYIIIVQSGNTRWQSQTISLSRFLLSGPNTKWSHTKTNPRLNCLNAIINHFDGLVHVGSSPIVIGLTILVNIHHIIGLVQCFGSRIFCRCTAIRIEIVVHDDAIHVIVVDNLHQHLQHISACFWISRINDLTFETPVIILNNPLSSIFIHLIRSRYTS